MNLSTHLTITESENPDMRTPSSVTKGSRLEAVAHYDNSPNNKSNPDPTKEIHWGEQTWDEMQYTGINYTIDNISPHQPARP